MHSLIWGALPPERQGGESESALNRILCVVGGRRGERGYDEEGGEEVQKGGDGHADEEKEEAQLSQPPMTAVDSSSKFHVAHVALVVLAALLACTLYCTVLYCTCVPVLERLCRPSCLGAAGKPGWRLHQWRAG